MSCVHKSLRYLCKDCIGLVAKEYGGRWYSFLIITSRIPNRLILHSSDCLFVHKSTSSVGSAHARRRPAGCGVRQASVQRSGCDCVAMLYKSESNFGAAFTRCATCANRVISYYDISPSLSPCPPTD